MVQVPREGDLQIEQHLDTQHRMWRTQRVGWAVMAVLLVLAFLGLFGSGPIASTSAGDPETLEVSYSRFVRRGHVNEVELHLGQNAIADGTATVRISEAFAKEVNLQGFAPQPETETSDGQWVIYEFPVPDGAEEVLIRGHLKYQRVGRITGRIASSEQAPVRFSQFVFP